MEAIREYAAGIAAAAMICAIALSFTDSMKPLMKLICGLVLTFAVVRPVLAFSAPDAFCFDYGLQAREAAQSGRRLADQALREIIIEKTEAYILDKASRLGLSIQVRVDLSREDPPAPERITITGPVSPYYRKQLTWFLREQLGIREEDLQWSS